MTKDLQIIVITGPTASGKTTLSTALAKKIDAEIISADSRAVYKGFDIVSAKPTEEEMCGIKHHLINIIEPDNDFSAGDFIQYSRKIIEDIKLRGKNIIITGGTWFYIKALLDDKMLPPIPADKNLRLELSQYSNDILWQKLKKMDFKRADQVNKNNRDKVIRSIEMCTFLNAPISEYKRKDNEKYDSIWFCPYIEREVLYTNINKRVDKMIDDGLIDEFEMNIKKWGKDNKIIKNTIGYQEFLEYNDIDEAIDKIKQHTRNFAKRQMTYFKNEKRIEFVKDKEEFLKRQH